MKVILTVLLSNLSKKPFRNIYLGICFMLCSGFLLSALVLNCSMERSFDKTYAKLDAPQLTAAIGESEVTEEKLEEFLKNSNSIRQYSVSKYYLANRVELKEDEMDFAYLISSQDTEVEYGCVIANNLIQNVTVGDDITVSINDKNITLKVTGVKLDPVSSAPSAQLPYFWVNSSQLDEITEGFPKGGYRTEIKFNNYRAGTSAAQFVTDYEQYIEKPFNGTLTPYESIRYFFMDRYTIFAKLFLFISIFIFAFVMIILVFLSKSNVKLDIKKIGILKSVGCSDLHIMLIYSLHYLLIAVLGNIVGLYLSGRCLNLWLSGIFANIDRSLFQISSLTLYQLGVFLFVGIALFIVVFVSIARVVKTSPIDAISMRSDRSSYKGKIILSTPKWLVLNLSVMKTLGHKAESIFIVIMALLVTLLNLTFVYVINGIGNADLHLADWGAVESDVYIARKSNADEKESGLLDALNHDPAVNFYYAALNDRVVYELSVNGITRNTIAEVYDKKIDDRLEFKFIKGRNPENIDEIAVGMNFAEANHLEIGDIMYTIRHGMETARTIVGIYPSYGNYANTIRFITEDIKEFFGNQANGYYTIVLNQGESPAAFSAGMGKRFMDFDFYPMDHGVSRSITILLPPILSIVLIFGVIFCVIMSCMVNILFAEQHREIKIFRAIGYTDKMIKRIYYLRFGIPMLFGALLAVPFSISIMPYLLKPISAQIGLNRLPIYPNISQVMLGFLCSMICYAISMGTIAAHKLSEELSGID